MRTLLLLVIFFEFINSSVKAQNDSLFNYKEDYSESTRRNNNIRRFWGIRITPKFESDSSVGKRFAKLSGFYEHPEFERSVDSTYQAFFSVPKWKAKLKRMQEVDQTLNVRINLYGDPSGEIRYSTIYILSRKERPCIADWFTEEELLELYQVGKRVKYDLSGLSVEYTGFIGDQREDYKTKEYDFVELGTSFSDIRRKMIKAGIY